MVDGRGLFGFSHSTWRDGCRLSWACTSSHTWCSSRQSVLAVFRLWCQQLWQHTSYWDSGDSVGLWLQVSCSVWIVSYLVELAGPACVCVCVCVSDCGDCGAYKLCHIGGPSPSTWSNALFTMCNCLLASCERRKGRTLSLRNCVWSHWGVWQPYMNTLCFRLWPCRSTYTNSCRQYIIIFIELLHANKTHGVSTSLSCMKSAIIFFVWNTVGNNTYTRIKLHMVTFQDQCLSSMHFF